MDSSTTPAQHSPMMGPILKRHLKEPSTPSWASKQVTITHEGVRDTSMQEATALITSMDGFTDAERLKLLKMLKSKFLSAEMLLGAGGTLLTAWLRSEMDEFDGQS